MPVTHIHDPQNYYVNLLDGRNSKMAPLTPQTQITMNRGRATPTLSEVSH